MGSVIPLRYKWRFFASLRMTEKMLRMTEKMLRMTGKEQRRHFVALRVIEIAFLRDLIQTS